MCEYMCFSSGTNVALQSYSYPSCSISSPVIVNCVWSSYKPGICFFVCILSSSGAQPIGICTYPFLIVSYVILITIWLFLRNFIFVSVLSLITIVMAWLMFTFIFVPISNFTLDSVVVEVRSLTQDSFTNILDGGFVYFSNAFCIISLIALRIWVYTIVDPFFLLFFFCPEHTQSIPMGFN